MREHKDPKELKESRENFTHAHEEVKKAGILLSCNFHQVDY